MSSTILDHQTTIRLGVFLAILGTMALAEVLSPRRRREIPRLIRWTNNLGLVLLDTFILRLVFPVAAMGLAVYAETNGWGLLNAWDVPTAVAIVASVLALDLTIYLQHVMFHAVPALWRLHQVHHADIEFDVTTALRFHPIEILLSMVVKLSIVAALGPPAVAVLIFEVLLNGTAMFNHANVRLPKRLDAVLRLVLVTPDMHRVHHSIYPSETNSNFGFNLPWWDMLLGTYTAQPRDGHEDMTIGVEQFRSRRDLWLDRLLIQPFRGRASGYSINRRKDD